MRKLTVALLFVIAILLAGRFWQELNSIANAGGDDPISTLLNGDVNGDQILDMSDAVYLLIHLFNGGPDPVAFGDTPEMLDRVALLEERVERILTPEERAILDHFSLVDLEDGQGGLARTVRLTGANLQVVNGLGATNGNPENPTASGLESTETNGLGNIFVGYQEPRSLSIPGMADRRNGSHNIVVGAQNDFTSYGGLVSGVGNNLQAPYGGIAGGSSQRVSTFAGTAQGCEVDRLPRQPTCSFNMQDCYGLAVNSDTGVVYALRNSGSGVNELLSYTPNSGLPSEGRGWFRGPVVADDIFSIVYDTQRSLLYGVTSLNLQVINPETGDSESVVREFMFVGSTRDWAYHPDTDRVYGFWQSGQRIYWRGASLGDDGSDDVGEYNFGCCFSRNGPSPTIYNPADNSLYTGVVDQNGMTMSRFDVGNRRFFGRGPGIPNVRGGGYLSHLTYDSEATTWYGVREDGSFYYWDAE